MPVMPKIPLARGDRWMDTSELAALFGADKETINRWAREGKLKGYLPTAKRRYFRKSDVNEFMKKKGLPTLD